MSVGEADARHLLRRVGFGPTAAEVAALAEAPTWADAVESVLDTTDEPPVSPPAALGDGSLSQYQRWVAATQWWIERMRTTPVPVVEKLALFWHGHFTSSADKVDIGLVFDQVDLYRRRALGDLGQLTQAMAVHPAMLVYLDNETNVAGKPNENFARELMELFCLGNGTHSEAEVVDMARAWTGHGLDDGGTRYEFRADRHDGGIKTLFGQSGRFDGPEVIDAMLTGPMAVTSSRFISAKLWRFLAGTNPAPATVDALAAGLRSSGLDLRRLTRDILLHPDLSTPAARTARVRSPVEWVVALLKALDVAAPDAHPEWYLRNLGHMVFRPPNVGGWPSGSAWISSSAVWARGNLAEYLRWVATDPDRGYQRFADLADRPPAEIADRALATFGVPDASPATRTVIADWAAGMQATPGRRWSIRPNVVPLVALSPDMALS